MEDKVIKVKYYNTNIFADIMGVNLIPQVFCLHGAGVSNRKIFDTLRKSLLENNISSCALDFIGYGETRGSVFESSLKSRTEQAIAVIEETKFIKPLVIIAGSMGAYNAIKLTELYPVDLLVLSGPAVYRKDAYEVNFGDKFSSLIRETKSWKDTDAWEILNRFKGKVLIIEAENDSVIPPEIIQRIYESANNSSYREIIKILNAPHRLMSYLADNNKDLKVVIDKIIESLK